MERNIPWHLVTLCGKAGSRTFLEREAVEADIMDILSLQDLVYASMENPALLALTTREEFETSVGTDCCRFFFDGETPVAFFQMVKNRQTERNLGAEKLGRAYADSVTMETIFVHPSYRGYGLQRYVISECEQNAREMGAAYAACTISPDNAYSLQNMIFLGYEVRTRCICYGDKDRFILEKDLMGNQNSY